MSEKIRTPSPLSSDLISSRARGNRSRGSSLARTPSVSNCGGRTPSTCVTARIRLSPNVSCATMRMPIMESPGTGARACGPRAGETPAQAPDSRHRPTAISRYFPVAFMLARACAGLRATASMSRRMRRSPSAGSAVDKRFDGAGKAVRNVEPGLLGDFDEPGRAGHVYFGQEVAYDIKPDHEQSFGRKLWADALGNLAITRGEGPRDAQAAGCEIATRLARLRDPGQNMRNRLAVDQDDALVAVGALGDEALRHDRSRAVMGQRLDDHVAVGIVDAHPKNRRASHAVERLQNHILVLIYEAAQHPGIPGDQRLHRELGKTGDGHFFIVIAHRARAIENERAFAFRGFEQIRRVDVFQVEGWVLAHHHRVERRQRANQRLARAMPFVIVFGHGKWPGRGFG